MIKTKQTFDKKEKSIVELDKLFKNIGKDCKFSNEKAVLKFGDLGYSPLFDTAFKSL